MKGLVTLTEEEGQDICHLYCPQGTQDVLAPIPAEIHSIPHPLQGHSRNRRQGDAVGQELMAQLVSA